MTTTQLGPSYYQAACFYAKRGNQERANALCDEGIQTLLEVNVTDGIEALFFEKAIIQDDPQKQFELLKQADYYAKQNKNLPLKALTREKLTSN